MLENNCVTFGVKDKVCWWLATGLEYSSTNKTDRHDIAEILLKVALIKHHNSNPYQETHGSVFLSVHI